MLLNREKALAFDFSQLGRVSPDVAPPQVIKTILHKAFQAPSFLIPRALLPLAIKMFKDRIDSGRLEPSKGPYRNPWFLGKKKEKGTYRLINAAMEYNKFTIRDVNLPPSADEFAEEFAGCKMSSLIDLFSGYDHVELAEESRDLTTFMTPLGLLRYTTLPQGATNSVAQFVRIVTKILQNRIPDDCWPFIDDIGVKGPISDYNMEECAPGIRRYVKEHIQLLDRTLKRLERAGCTISGTKSQFCMDGIKLVGFICGAEGRTPETAKIIKIIEWPACQTIGEARAFVGICVYYRIWIEGFAIIAAPIYILMRKNVPFVWGEAQHLAMEELKLALTRAPALVRIVYGEGAGEIILVADASGGGWGAVLMQLDEKGLRHPS